MKSKKVWTKLVVGYKKYRYILVDESEVEKVREVNRLTWRDMKREARRRAKLEESGIIISSFDEIEEESEYIPNPNVIDPLVELICDENRREIRERVQSAIAQLNERQRTFIQRIYFEGKTVKEVAEEFGISEPAVSQAMNRIYAALKKIFEKN